MRYFHVSVTDGIEYYANELLTASKGCLPWDTITYIYELVNSTMMPEANDPELFYFAIRFSSRFGEAGGGGSGLDGDASSTSTQPPPSLTSASCDKEHVLLVRTESPKERKEWTEYLVAARAEHRRLRMLAEEDEEGNDIDGPQSRRRRRRNGGDDDGGGASSVRRGGNPLMNVVTNYLRKAVSLKKRRFQTDGIDLDLAYITPRIIALGYPAEGREAMFRNPYSDVVAFFDRYHPKGKYRVYNLCSERCYPPSRFGGRFERFPFDDHNPSPLALVVPFCESVAAFLAADPDHVIAAHCKAGKGRTGMMICCYLLYANICPDAASALLLFGEKRTMDGKGVQIPSQKRYIEYFDQLVHTYHGVLPPAPPRGVIFQHLWMSCIPRFDPDGGCDPFVIIEKRRDDHGHKPCGTREGTFHNPMEVVFDSRVSGSPKHLGKGATASDGATVPLCCHLQGDEFRITVFDEDQLSKDDVMFSFWVHTSFLPPTSGPGASSSLTLQKLQLDHAVKDKKNELFDADFRVSLAYSM